MALDRQCKIVLIGDGSVGKSSLIARFRTEGFAPRYHQTVGVDFFEKRLQLRGAQGVRLQIWDIGGQSISSQMLPKYLYRSQVVLIVYDLTSFTSLENCDDWLAAVKRAFTDKHTAQVGKLPDIYLVGNKCDLLSLRQVTDERHADFWRGRGLSGGYLASARSGENVARAVFQACAHAMGVDLTAHELAFHDKVLGGVVVDDAEGPGRTADADRIEAEDLALEAAKHRRGCACAVS